MQLEHQSHQVTPRSLAEPTDQQAISYFFGHILPPLSGHCLDYLPSLFNTNKMPRLVERTVIALAYSFTSLDPSQAHLKYHAIREYNRTTQAARNLVTQPRFFNSDHLLIMLFMFMVWEVPLTLSFLVMPVTNRG